MTDKPLLIFDGDCGFCRRWIERWKMLTGDQVDYASYQEVGDLFPQISKSEFEKSVILIEDGKPSAKGALAVFKTLSARPFYRLLLNAYHHVPGFRQITEGFYSLVAGNRVFFSHLTHFFWGDDVRPSTYRFSSWLFIKVSALIYFFAFLSAAIQVKGLLGVNGILPVNLMIEQLNARFGWEKILLIPSIFWLNQSDFFLVGICWLGALSALLLFRGIAPAFCAALCWMIYLSLFSVGRDFMSFQWDILLLESGFLLFFLCPMRLRQGSWQKSSVPAMLHLLFVFLFFRLMFLSGVVKLVSGDRIWRNLTALEFHYFTQPLPTWIGYFAHQLPPGAQKFSCAVMFFIELVLPFFIFFPRQIRHSAVWVMIGFQILILLTGNYCFFNLLAIALALLLFDDSFWKKKLPSSDAEPKPFWPKPLMIPFAIFMIAMSLMPFTLSLRWKLPWPKPMIDVYSAIHPFRLVNSYGLFAIMTDSRMEITIEGSNDGEHWKEYQFQYKPGDPKRRPKFNIPHQPRLDWQMWFAALGNYDRNPWFVNFCYRLLQGKKEVLDLLEENPFGDKPPRFVRAAAYDYRFTDMKTLFETGEWWKRERTGLYMPSISLKS